MLEELKQGNTVVGIKQLRRALDGGKVKKVFLAEDADPILIDPVAQLCAEIGVECEAVQTMRALGAACGISVGAAAAAILV
ncbi:MAG: ribosomal L7Ae/L30e/S12e/Gadd45 family protein [Clostridiales bacterium]|nr:ribosomal L7Ae/L30e/S12e/Gadd45 family protein [Clostridiales bacterium]